METVEESVGALSFRGRGGESDSVAEARGDATICSGDDEVVVEESMLVIYATRIRIYKSTRGEMEVDMSSWKKIPVNDR